MHNFAMLGEDGGEGGLHTIGACNAIYLPTHIMLAHTRTSDAHGCGVHFVAYAAGLLYFGYFECRFHRAHLHHSVNQGERRSLLLLSGMNAQQVHDLDFGVVPIRRQEVDAPTCRLCCR